MNEYRHGAYADQEDSLDYTSPSGVGTVPVYIGRAPIHQLPDYDNKTNVPILITSWEDGRRKIGYSDLWSSYDLCEAVYAHFRNSVNSVGPIVVINTLNPSDKKNEMEQTAAVKFIKRKAVITNSRIIISTLNIEDKIMGVDYNAKYSDDGMSVLLEDLKGDIDSVEVKYYEVDPAAVTDEDVVTGINKGVPLIYNDISVVPTILCAPGWSHKNAVFSALVSIQNQINGHWYAWINADIDSSKYKTIEDAIVAKEDYEIETGAGGLLWPMAKKGKRIYHASTLCTVTMQWVDYKNNNMPYETPSNKPIDIDSLCLADGSVIKIDQSYANRLNANGINTMIYWEGIWRMWGSHTMKYGEGVSINSRDIFDCNVRMMRYIENTALFKTVLFCMARWISLKKIIQAVTWFREILFFQQNLQIRYRVRALVIKYVGRQME